MPVFAKPPVVTWLPTRRCNLNCEYCRIKDNDFNELMEEDIFRIITMLKKHFADSFLVILGGDVTVWGKKRLKRFVKRLGNLRYAIVTNGVLLNEQYLRELKKCGLKNISLSADPMGCRDRSRKTQVALELVEIARKLELKDRHVTITLDSQNFKGAPALVKRLTKVECWSEITPYIAYPSPDYDFGFYNAKFVFHMRDFYELKRTMKQLVQMKHDGFLIHNTSDYLKAFADNVCREEYKYRCTGMTNLVIDADGTLRPCLHIRGEQLRKFSVLEWVLSKKVPFKKLHTVWKADVAQQCHGCFWNCQVESEWVFKKYRSLGVDGALEKVKDYFEHRSD